MHGVPSKPALATRGPVGESWLAGALDDSAAAVRLIEGPAGAWAVLDAIHRLEPTSVRNVSRASRIPVPVVAALCNELRTRAAVARRRPLQLTDRARRLLGPAPPPMAPRLDAATKPAIPDALRSVVDAMGEVARLAPPADATLDQAHCTPETKVRRAMALLGSPMLRHGGVAFLGDDDLTSVALLHLARHVGALDALPPVTVLDVDERLVEFLRTQHAGFGGRHAVLRHDLRAPLPEAVRHACGVVFSDPPYTLEGARLFAARAVEAMRPGIGAELFLCFGAGPPDDALALDHALHRLGLATRALLPAFNDYDGAGTLAGISDLRVLVAANGIRPVPLGRHEGRIYTGEGRAAGRPYRCVGCGAVWTVAPAARWSTVAELKASRCADCGADRFRPLPRSPRT